MLCPKCGIELPEDAKSCPTCGYVFEEKVVIEAEANDVEVETVIPEVLSDKKGPSPKKALIFGIISVAAPIVLYPITCCCSLPIGQIAGLIFAILGLLAAKRYAEFTDEPSTSVKVGKILSIVGLVLGIAAIVLFVFGLVFGFLGGFVGGFMDAFSNGMNY